MKLWICRANAISLRIFLTSLNFLPFSWSTTWGQFFSLTAQMQFLRIFFTGVNFQPFSLPTKWRELFSEQKETEALEGRIVLKDSSPDFSVRQSTNTAMSVSIAGIDKRHFIAVLSLTSCNCNAEFAFANFNANVNLLRIFFTGVNFQPFPLPTKWRGLFSEALPILQLNSRYREGYDRAMRVWYTEGLTKRQAFCVLRQEHSDAAVRLRGR